MPRDKIKIYLLTFNSALSYGAALQTYALNRVLQDLNCNVQIIDFRAPFIPPFPTGFWSLKTNYNLTRFRKEIIFYKFRKQYLNNKTRAIYSIRGLRNYKFYADYYIVGSDQVWNPDITKKYAFVYFLDFVNGNKLSYAASFGKDEWNYNSTFNKTVVRLLDKFQAISVREEESQKILYNVFGRLGTTVLDPTLLLEDYSEFVSDIILKDQISCINVNNSQTVLEVTSNLQGELGIPAYALDSKKKSKNILPVPYVSVQKWLKYIAESKYVVTDSFHGVTFCILFQKQFVAVNTHPERFVRIRDLLTRLDLKERIVESNETNSVLGLIEKRIDYTLIYLKLDKLKAMSVNFLKEQFSKDT